MPDFIEINIILWFSDLREIRLSQDVMKGIGVEKNCM